MDEKNANKLSDENPGGRDDLIEELSRAESRIEELTSERDKLAEKVCDVCAGSGTYYLINDETEVRRMFPCVCVSETEPYQELKTTLSELVSQIDMSTFVDELGHPAKKLKAFAAACRILKE